MQIAFDGPPGPTFHDVIRALPDGRAWLVSDPTGRVVIARSEGAELVREVILSSDEEGWTLECLASRGVSELAVMALVGAALGSSILALAWSWFAGPDGALGFALGLVLALGVPSGVIVLGRGLIDPGRDQRAERNLERAVRHAVATVSAATLLNTDG